MEITVRKFRSFQEADKADTLYYGKLTPKQRIEIMLTLTQQPSGKADETEPRLERVFRIIELSQS